MVRGERIFSFFFETFFLAFLFLFFLKLGSDGLEGPVLQKGYAVLWGSLFLCLWGSGFEAQRLKGLPFIFIAIFLGYEVLRALWGAAHLVIGRGVSEESLSLYRRYVGGVIPWFLYGGFFSLAHLSPMNREKTGRLMALLATGGFVLSLAAIPPLVSSGLHGYALSAEGVGIRSFFPPFVYFRPWVEEYFVSRYAHPNYVGDVIALGFFPAAGLLFYALQRGREITALGKKGIPHWVSSLGLWGVLVGAQALAIVLLFSRGTILCFFFAFAVFLWASFRKFPSRGARTLSMVMIVVVAGFLFWRVNLPSLWKELGTIQKDFANLENSTFSTTIEGSRRAIRIYQNYPLWGAGTGAYSFISKAYATPGIEHYGMMDLKAFSHYFQVIAEEGSGALFYFLFVLSYLVTVTALLCRTRSRFQFLAGLSLTAPVLMVFAHALVKPVMDYFAIAMPIYLLMGLSLAVLRADFTEA